MTSSRIIIGWGISRQSEIL